MGDERTYRAVGKEDQWETVCQAINMARDKSHVTKSLGVGHHNPLELVGWLDERRGIEVVNVAKEKILDPHFHRYL